MSSNINKLILFRLFFWMHFMGAVLIPFLCSWGGITLQQVLMLNAWFMLCSFILEVPTGAIADLWGRKYSLMLAALALIMGSLIYASMPHIAVFAIAEIFFALAFTLASGADQALAYDSLILVNQEKKSKAVITKLETAKLSGIIFGALIGSAIVLTGNYRLPMLWQWIPAGIAFFLALSLQEAPRQTKEKYHHFVLKGFQFFAKHPIIIALSADLILVGSLSWLMIWLYQALLIAVKVPVPYFGIIHVLIALAQIGVIQTAPYLEKIFGQKKRVLLFLSIATGVFFIIAGIIQIVSLLIIAIIGAIACGLSREPLFTNYLQKYIPSTQRATILSIISMLKTLTIMIINIVAGFFINQHLNATTIGIGIVILIVSLFTFFEEKHLQD